MAGRAGVCCCLLFSLRVPRITDLRGQLPTNGQYENRPLASVQSLVVHHSGTEHDSSAADIARYHISLGWPGCGYHFVVRWNGHIEWAQGLEVMSYNVARRNHEVVGICLPGNYTTRPGRAIQCSAARALIAWLLANSLPGRSVVGHKQIALASSPTACPGRLMEWLE